VYDCIGDTCNVAARMESTGVPGKIHISRTTYELVWQSFECEERGMIDVKGKGKMQTFLVK
jgi:class 3 adenylate cyclase